VTSFPVLDAEPGRPSVRRRLRSSLIILGIVIVLVGLGMGGSALRGRHSSNGPTSIVAYQSEALSAYAVDGSKPVSFTSVGLVSEMPAPSPDGTLLLSGSGQLVTMNGPTPTSVNTKLYDALNDDDFTVNGFAGGDGYVVVFDFNGGPVTLAATDTGATHQLGTGGYAVGDPTAPAVYVTTPLGPVVGSGDDSYQPAGSIERRGINIPTTVIATAPDIEKRLGISATAKIEMFAYPDPTGRNVAMYVIVHNGSSETYALAVYSRSGTFIGALPSISDCQNVWSPSGSTLYYQATESPGQISSWQPGSTGPSSKKIALPPGISDISQCSWSPNGSSSRPARQAMCSAVHTSDHSISGWLLLDTKAGTATLINQTSNPVLWAKGTATASKGGS
jgi:hypothetical protein